MIDGCQITGSGLGQGVVSISPDANGLRILVMDSDNPNLRVEILLSEGRILALARLVEVARIAATDPGLSRQLESTVEVRGVPTS